MNKQTELEKDVEAQLELDRQKTEQPEDVTLEVQNVTTQQEDTNDG